MSGTQALPGPFSERLASGNDRAYPWFGHNAQSETYLELAELSPETVYQALHRCCLSVRMQLGLAESCTGGLVAKLITDSPGSSKYLYGGWVVYSNHAKFTWLQVSPHDLENRGAVSEIVVRDLLRGIFENSPCSHGIAISGVAGPDGGSPEKPVGTVWIGAASRRASALVREFRFAGDRKQVRESAAVVAALQLMELLWLEENQIDTVPKL